jgi:hypothetical protein
MGERVVHIPRSTRLPRRVAAGGFAAVIALVLTPVLAGAASGTWTLATSPNPGTSGNSLLGVSCPNANDCWAVGYQQSSGQEDQTLIEHWEGSTWSVVTSGNENGALTTQSNQLSGVTCTSVSDCWAVGTFVLVVNESASYNEPLWDHWNGTSWTPSTFPSGVIPTEYWLKAVSCADATHCWAVGYKTTGIVERVWIQQWNGTTWTDDPSTDAGILYGVSCVDTTHCWAVGEDTSSPLQTRIEAWNGTAWSAATSPDANASENVLNSVSCVDTSHCWAAGFYFGSTEQNLLVQWNGSSWSVASSAASNNNTPSANRNFLEGVTCMSADYCWAVGASIVSGGHPDRTLIDLWDGTSWALVPGTPNSPDTTMNDELRSVACGDTGHCAAAGDTFSPDPTLIVQFAVPVTPTPTPSIPVPPTGAAGPGSSASPAGIPFAPLLLGGGLMILGATGAARLGRRRRDQP